MSDEKLVVEQGDFDDPEHLQSMHDEDLFALVNNYDAEPSIRELAFQIYWGKYIKALGKLDDVAIRGILRYREVFPIEAEGLLTTACWDGVLTRDQAANLTRFFPEDTVAGPVLAAYEFIADAELDPLIKIKRLLGSAKIHGSIIRSYCWRLIPFLGKSDLYDAALSIIGSKLSKEHRTVLISRVMRQADANGIVLPEIPEFPEDVDAHENRLYAKAERFTASRLYQAYNDGATDLELRRICFQEFWDRHFIEPEDSIMATRSDIEEICSWVHAWPNQVNSLMSTLCRNDLIQTGDAEWLLTKLANTEPAYHLVRLYTEARDERLTAWQRVESIAPFFSVEFWPSMHASLHVVANAQPAELDRIEAMCANGVFPERAAIRIHFAILRRKTNMSNTT